MTLLKRHGSTDVYRYGFQGQEKDDEVKGEGNSYNYKYRMHDPRIGRFFATDPMEAIYNWYSPYAFSGNKVIDAIEMEGLQPFYITKPKEKTITAGVKFKVINKTKIKTEIIDKILDKLKIKFKTQLSKEIKNNYYEQLEGSIIIDNKSSYEIIFLTKKEFEKMLLEEKKATKEQIEKGLYVALANDIKGDKIYVSDATIDNFAADWVDPENLLPFEDEQLDDTATAILHEVDHLLGLLHTYDLFSLDAKGQLVVQIESIKELWENSSKEIKDESYNKPNSATREIVKNIMSMGQEGNFREIKLSLKDISSEIETGETFFKLTADQVEEIYKNIKEYVNEENNKKED